MITTKFAYYATFRGCPLIRYNKDIKEKFVNAKDLNPRPLNESCKLNNQA